MKQKRLIVLGVVVLFVFVFGYLYLSKVKDDEEKTSFTASHVCQQKNEELKKVSIDIEASDPKIVESLRAWEDLYLQQNSDIVNREFLDKYLHIYNVEIQDVPAAAHVDSEKYLSIDYAFVYDWAYKSERGGMAIQLKGQPQMNYNELLAYHSAHAVTLPWISSFHIPQDEKQSMRNIVQNTRNGLVFMTCEEVVNELNDSCTNIKDRGYRDIPNFLLSFGGTIDRGENKCGIGSIDLFTKSISYQEQPCWVN